MASVNWGSGTNTLYTPKYNFGTDNLNNEEYQKQLAEYNEKKAKYELAKETMLKNGYTIDSNNNGLITLSQVAHRTTDANGNTVETIIPRNSSVSTSAAATPTRTLQVSEALANYSSVSAQPTTQSSTQQEPDFSEFTGNDTLTYQAKTQKDFTEAEQALLNAGFVKIGTDKSGKVLYEQRISSTRKDSKPEENRNSVSIPQTINQTGNTSGFDISSILGFVSQLGSNGSDILSSIASNVSPILKNVNGILGSIIG